MSKFGSNNIWEYDSHVSRQNDAVQHPFHGAASNRM